MKIERSHSSDNKNQLQSPIAFGREIPGDAKKMEIKVGVDLLVFKKIAQN